MPWSGSPGSQTFSRTDGTRTGTTVWQQAQAAAVDIDSPDHDTHDQDIATGLNSALKNDGGNTATANLPMGGFRHTNVGAAQASTDYARFSDLQNAKGIYIPATSVGGSADAITLTTGYSISSYVAGQQFVFIAAGTNTGAAATVNVDGVGAKSLTGPAGSNFNAGLIVQNAVVTINYQATADRFEVATTAPTAIAVGTIMAWPASVIPSGWLECNGQAVSRTTYAALFAGIGTAYGAGDLLTTFNVPDYRGYFLRGQDHGAGNDPDAASRTDRGDGTTGDNVGTKQADQLKSHNHTANVTDPGHVHNVPFEIDVAFGSGGVGAVKTIPGSGGTPGTGAANSNTTGITVANVATGGNESRGKNINVLWIILALPSAAFAPGGAVVLQAGTATLAPLKFTAGINLTTPAAGAEEFDGSVFYATAVASSRQVVDTEQFTTVQGSAVALTNNITSAQDIFGTGGQVITLAAATTYFFEGFFNLQTGTTTHTTALGLVASSAFTGIFYWAELWSTTSGSISTTAPSVLDVSGSTATVLNATSTAPNTMIRIKGVVRTNAASTLTPQVTFSSGPTGTCQTNLNSWFRIWPIGSNTVQAVGHWA